MTWWPGWDSAESAGFWSQLWFWVGIVCLFAVGASAIASHVYGLRRDRLISDELASLAARHKAEVEGQQSHVEKSSTSVAEPHTPAPPKVLTPEQQRILIAALSPFAGQSVRVYALVGSNDRLVDDFVEVFRETLPASPSRVVLAKRIFGLQPTVNAGGNDPPAFSVLVDTLSALGLAANTGFADGQTPPGVIDMKIGILGSH
jgi:hypothetical protein